MPPRSRRVPAADPLISFFAKLTTVAQGLLSSLTDLPDIRDFPRYRRSFEAALRFQVAQSDPSLLSVESFVDREIDALRRANLEARSAPSLLLERSDKLQNRLLHLRSAIGHLEQENDGLAGRLKLPRDPDVKLEELRQAVSHEKRQKEALQRSIESLTTDLRMMEHRLDALAKNPGSRLLREEPVSARRIVVRPPEGPRPRLPGITIRKSGSSGKREAIGDSVDDDEFTWRREGDWQSSDSELELRLSRRQEDWVNDSGDEDKAFVPTEPVAARIAPPMMARSRVRMSPL
jgi:hypothetical protein